MSPRGFDQRTIWFLLAGLLLCGAGSVWAELIPTPEFSQHPIPTSRLPGVDAAFWDYLDVAALVVALSLASYFALVTRSRRHLFLLTIASVAWFGFWRQGCVCPIGSTQNVALALFDPQYVLPWSVVAFFLLPLIFTLFFGRTFCAAVCPLGAVQELAAVKRVQVPRWLDHCLGLVPYLYLGAAMLLAASGTAFLICRYDPFVAFFRLSGNANMVIFGLSLLAIGIFVGRPYCRYLCPYGALLRLISPIAKWHVTIPPTECINCHLCHDVCPYGAIEPPIEPATPEQAARGRRRLVVVFASAPVLIAVFTGLGGFLQTPLSRFDRDVQLAEQLRREALGLGTESTDATDAFRAAQREEQELYQEVLAKQHHYRRLGWMLGAWAGFVLSVKLVSLAMRRRQEDYRARKTDCVSCGRCFWYCPVEQVRLGLIDDPAEMTGAR